MRSIYVAGGSSEAAEVAEMIARLKAIGYEVTYDWTKEVLAATTPERYLPRDRMIEAAKCDLVAIDNADIFWLMIPKKTSIGSSFEFAYAYTRGYSPIYISGDHRSSIFYQLAEPYLLFGTHEKAFAMLLSERRTVKKS
jgi:hypothetical protein